MDASENAPPVTMSRLRAAFARMLGKPADSLAPPSAGASPEGIVEALLFVGRADGAPLTAEELAGAMRDVTPQEVEAIAASLDARYRQDGAALRIDRSGGGMRLGLAEGLERVADRLRTPVRAAKLSRAAIDCLAIVAYRQPIDRAGVEELRDEASVAPLRQLLRLGLVAEAPGEPAEGGGPPPPRYVTTDRFLRLVGVASLRQLPRLGELGD